MGRRGPKPTPTSVLKLRGTLRKGRRRAEPIPQGSAPPPPEWLLPAARDEWERLRPELERLKLLTGVDWGTFAMYCQCFARWRAAEEQLSITGPTLEILDAEGHLKYSQVSPHVTIAHKCLERLNKLAAEFGLTPSARSRISAPAIRQPATESVPEGLDDDEARILGFKAS